MRSALCITLNMLFDEMGSTKLTFGVPGILSAGKHSVPSMHLQQPSRLQDIGAGSKPRLQQQLHARSSARPTR